MQIGAEDQVLFFRRVDTAADLGVTSALISIVIVIALTWVGLAARESEFCPPPLRYLDTINVLTPPPLLLF
jgi:hypothetical protein